MSKLATRRNQTKKEARELFKRVIAERGIIDATVVKHKIHIPKKIFLFTDHAKQRLWERFAVRVSELKFDDFKVIPKKIIDSKKLGITKGLICFGKDNILLVTRQYKVNQFYVVTVYKKDFNE